MHTLTLFPQLLTFGMLAPTLLRLAVSLLILFLGYQRFSKENAWAGIIYLASGVMLILGWYTQIGAILGIVVIKFDFWFDKKNRNTSSEHWALYVLSIVILLSLLVTGPGFLAFDWPL